MWTDIGEHLNICNNQNTISGLKLLSDQHFLQRRVRDLQSTKGG